MNRRAARLASSLRRRLPDPAPAGSGLSDCPLCGRDAVVPVEWEPVGKERWWMFLRCAECGTSREVTVTNAVAMLYDQELARGIQEIAKAAHQLEHERMAADADAFVDALRHDFIEPADFAR
jgi:transcription elongation factor Elf1